MISQRVKNYIAEQSFCSEYLFKDWEGFLKVPFYICVAYNIDR